MFDFWRYFDNIFHFIYNLNLQLGKMYGIINSLIKKENFK